MLPAGPQRVLGVPIAQCFETILFSFKCQRKQWFLVPGYRPPSPDESKRKMTSLPNPQCALPLIFDEVISTNSRSWTFPRQD
jgi:hypothetical protein